MKLAHGSTPIGYKHLINQKTTLKIKHRYILSQIFEPKLSTPPFLVIPHWLISDQALSIQERMIIILLLCRDEDKKDSSAYQLSRATKETPRTISRILNSLIEKKIIKRYIQSPRVSFYSIRVSPLYSNFVVNNSEPAPALKGHLLHDEWNMYFHPSIYHKFN